MSKAKKTILCTWGLALVLAAPILLVQVGLIQSHYQSFNHSVREIELLEVDGCEILSVLFSLRALKFYIRSFLRFRLIEPAF